MTWSTAAAASTRSTSAAPRSAGETFSIDRQRLRGDCSPVANGTIDLTGVERIQFEAQGQNADNITINDLTGTDVKQVAIDLGAGTAAAAMVRRTRSTSTRPTATRSRSPTTTAWSRCRVWPATVTISNFEADLDQLFINGQPVTVADGQTVTVAAVNSNNTGGTSTASDGSHAAGLALLGQSMASSFVTAGDGHGATPIADQPSSQQPLLTQPHA